MQRTVWEEKASNMIKSELEKRNMSYTDLVNEMKKIGIEENYNNLNVKINRGKFPVGFFLQVCKALKIKKINLT